jgi:phage gp37-like protein
MKFEEIETKIIEALRTELVYLKTVSTYAGELKEELKRLGMSFPAAYIVYKGSSFNHIDGHAQEEKVQFTVLVAAKNLKGGESLRKSSNGAYQLINDILAALTNQTFGLSIERVRPVRVSLVFISETAAVYGMDFETSFDKTY